MTVRRCILASWHEGNDPMKLSFIKILFSLIALILLTFTYALGQASTIPSAKLLYPADVVKILQQGKDKPLLIQVGSHVLYAQAHIPGSEYIRAAATEPGLQQLRQRVASLPKNEFMILYCGCCPWSHCPNLKPAFDALNGMGFTNVRFLYIENNFGADWVNKGYPSERGE